MPTYQYECASCGHELEELQSMTEKKLKKCPKCGKNTLQRLIGSGTGIIFKGSGFYETDYKRKTPASARGARLPAVGQGSTSGGQAEPAKKPTGGCHSGSGPCACAHG